MSVEPHTFVHSGDEVLILRRCKKDRTSYHGFTYPEGIGAVVESPSKWWGIGSPPSDLKIGWDTSATCGNGLFGWPWGFGIGDGSDFYSDDIWLVIGAKPADVVGNIGDGWKCKFRAGIIRYDGHFAGALAMLRSGFHDCIKSMAAVEEANLSSGDYAKSAQSGDYAASSQSGKDSVSTISGNNGKAKTGDRGCFALTFWDEETGWEIIVGKVGRDGIKADTWYEVARGKLVESEVQS